MPSFFIQFSDFEMNFQIGFSNEFLERYPAAHGRRSQRPVARLDIQRAIFDSKSDFAPQRYKSRKSPLTILAADRHLSAKNSIAKADLRWLGIFPKLKKNDSHFIISYFIFVVNQIFQLGSAEHKKKTESSLCPLDPYTLVSWCLRSSFWPRSCSSPFSLWCPTINFVFDLSTHPALICQGRIRTYDASESPMRIQERY